ncbi:hypothetical protein GOBAR_AA11499 [Gossypium barbadense]|uniref:Uncharacterized protein n=1 Tax=Gossypium barbadense TaxID=3634 RepID=A0A2P5Y0M5_GOSBA|nr:hypothetical protein GOBAR_AA11499 [Gossypium barbadense]
MDTVKGDGGSGMMSWQWWNKNLFYGCFSRGVRMGVARGFSAESLEWLFRPSLNRNEENSSQNLLQTFSANAFKIASFITTIQFQIWRYGATDENLLINIHYSALEQTQIEVQTLEGQMEPEVLLAGSIDGSFRSGLVSIIKSMGAWMDQELKIFDFDLSRNFESDTSSERPSTSIVENGVVPDCELYPEMNFELSDIATLEQRRAYKIELQVGNFFMLG